MLVSFASWGLLAWRVLGWLWVDGDFVREWRFSFSSEIACGRGGEDEDEDEGEKLNR